MKLEDVCAFIMTSHKLVYPSAKKLIKTDLKLISPQVSSQYS